MISRSVFILGLNVVMSNISFQNFCQRGQTEDCYQTQRRNGRHSNDENGMFCDFLFDLSMFCPNIFSKIIKVKTINC